MAMLSKWLFFFIIAYAVNLFLLAQFLQVLQNALGMNRFELLAVPGFVFVVAVGICEALLFDSVWCAAVRVTRKH